MALARRIAVVPAARHPRDQAVDDGRPPTAIDDARAREEEAFRRAFGRPEGLAEGTAPSVH